MVKPSNSLSGKQFTPTIESIEPDVETRKEQEESYQYSNLLQKYRSLRKKVARIHDSSYDISNICNLRCEGCLYFSDIDRSEKLAVSELAQWNNFFKAEAARGINFAYLAGAEPALTPERISACHDHIPYGVVFSNGSRKIHANINYRIHVSLWGDENSSKLYRDGNMHNKGIAIDCANRLNNWHRHYNADLSQNSGKCCSANIDCKDCRAYAIKLGTYLTKFKPLSR